ncbi:MAG: hypothetical protein A2W19_16510 [Spirochaetes bacterium RBG_16_49_21]|nr:MAG: hypothetical protein A2W19_16510 [Spirochaetes bacterium RBG_16_49_21]
MLPAGPAPIIKTFVFNYGTLASLVIDLSYLKSRYIVKQKCVLTSPPGPLSFLPSLVGEAPNRMLQCRARTGRPNSARRAQRAGEVEEDLEGMRDRDYKKSLT